VDKLRQASPPGAIQPQPDNVAQHSPIAARYLCHVTSGNSCTTYSIDVVVCSKFYCTTNKIYAVSFTLSTMTTTYELRNVTHVTRARWVRRNAGPICGPNFANLSAHAQNRLQFVLHLTISCFIPEIFAIKLRSFPTFVPNFNQSIKSNLYSAICRKRIRGACWRI